MYASFSKNFKIAIGGSLCLAIVLFGASFLLGRETFFLFLNTDLGKIGDFVFDTFSDMAEGWNWIPYFIIFYGRYKKDAVLILLNFLISTLLTQIPKIFIWDTVSRPMASGIPHDQIHTVDGVVMHMWNSFPSGHTATAFTFFLLTVYFSPKKFVLILGALFAIGCGYSRIYLAQHFPLDVAGGMIVAIITVLISLYLRNKINKNVPKIN
jgi:membrane-associated phospholipid phosphatase